MQQVCPCGSGMPFTECHAKYTAPAYGAFAPAPIVSAPPTTDARRLDLACGTRVQDGFLGIDLLAPTGPHIVRGDVLVYPWTIHEAREGWEIGPIPDSSIDEIYCSHFLEHIPMDYVDNEGRVVLMSTPGARDAILRFFDEVYRVLKPGGIFRSFTPCPGSNRAFQDPTHRRFIPPEFFAYYLPAPARIVNGLGHYRVDCDFECFQASPVTDIPTGLELQAMPEQVAMRYCTTQRNIVKDWDCRLRAVKPARTTASLTPPAQPISAPTP